MINKKVMALAVAGALAAPAAAFAQASNVQIYGTFDVSINSINHSGYTTYTGNAPAGASINGVTKFDVYNQSSRLGFKGVEDLGNGLKAWFQIENNIAADGRQFNNTAGIGARNTAVGLEGSFGNVLMGNWDSPYKSSEAIWNISGVGGYAGLQNLLMHNNDSTGANPDLNCTNVTTTNSSTVTAAGTGVVTLVTQPVCGQLSMANTSFSNRMSNTIQYWSPVFSGFQAKFAMRANEEKNESATGAKNSPQSWALTTNWTKANAGVTFGYEKHTGWRDRGVSNATITYTANAITAVSSGAATAGLTTNNNVDDTAWTLGGNYNFGVVQVSAAMEQMKFGNNNTSADDTSYSRKNYYLGLAAPVGNGTIRAGYSWTPGNSSCGAGVTNTIATTATTGGTGFCDGGLKASAMQLGYEYNLSKRTMVYGSFAKLDNGNNTRFNFSTPTLNQTAAAGGTGTGQDVTIWGAGIKHSF
ncbi:MAG: porin [Proteobacteria bacterium]|nr:porin [Pseudomonadota bacterium]